MAQISKPDWQPRPVTSMPVLTTVTFNVRPGGSATLTRVHYQLISPRVVFASPADTSLLPPAERGASDPKPSPSSRSERVIDDDYVLPSGLTKVTRALRLELVSPELKPATATLLVTIFDVTSSGDLVGKATDSQQITFTL